MEKEGKVRLRWGYIKHDDGGWIAGVVYGKIFVGILYISQWIKP
jgi:hypothetical protein